MSSCRAAGRGEGERPGAQNGRYDMCQRTAGRTSQTKIESSISCFHLDATLVVPLPLAPLVLASPGRRACNRRKSGVPRPVTYRAQCHLTSSNVKKQRGTYSVPPRDRGESIGATAWILATCDIVETSSATSVQPAIEEAKGALAVGNPVVIKKRYYGRYKLVKIGGQSDSSDRT